MSSMRQGNMDMLGQIYHPLGDFFGKLVQVVHGSSAHVAAKGRLSSSS